MYDSTHQQFFLIESFIWCDCGNVNDVLYEFDPIWVSMRWWFDISLFSIEIDSVIIVVGVVLCFSWHVDLWCDWLHPWSWQGLIFHPRNSLSLSNHTLNSWGKCFHTRKLSTCCGHWVSGGYIAHLNISDSFIWQITQVLQLLMAMSVLGFLGHEAILILQLLLDLMRRCWACQIGKVRSQLCLKFYRLW